MHRWSRGAYILAALLLTVVTLSQNAQAQTWPQHTLWSSSPLRLNPASSANLFSLDGTATLRRQWVGLDGAPTTTQVAVGAPIYIIGAGASLGFEYDEIGVQSVSLARGAFSYQVLDAGDLAISAGAGVSYRLTSFDASRLRTSGGTYNEFINDPADDLLPSMAVNGSALGFDVGVEAKWRETTVGISILDVNAPTADLDGLERRYAPTYLLHALTVLPVAELIDLEASLLTQSDLSVWQTQVAAQAWYDGNIGLGAALRGFSGSTLDAVSLLVGWRPSPTVTISYGYDYGLSSLQRAHDGSHEIAFRYVMSTPIGKGKLPPAIFNPRL